MTAITHGVHHVGLTVHNPQQAADFFVEALGFQHAGARPAARFVSDGQVLLTLWAAEPAARDFARYGAIGLHHLALRLHPDAELDAVCAALAARPDVTLEFAPEDLGASGLRHCMLTGPSGLRLELVASAT
ncbi:MAG: VOC family protein [Alphaproteobacteria bacterium]|nr:VOC family protein [Alphaproteobacteria bacterium]MCB9792146.1 VOC family protein [Alphaproteobacteria bacterium]